MEPNNQLNAMCYTASEGNSVLFFTVMLSYYWRTSCRNVFAVRCLNRQNVLLHLLDYGYAVAILTEL